MTGHGARRTLTTGRESKKMQSEYEGSVAMPIDEQILDCSVYLFRSGGDARYTDKGGASSFLVGVPGYGPHWLLPGTCPQPDLYHLYAVTARHVITRSTYQPGWMPSCVIRINTHGGMRVLEYHDNDWICSNEHDIAVAPVRYEPAFRSRFIEVTGLLTREIMEKHEIGIGDDVIMVGRFVTHDGRNQNNPSMRHGKISIMPRENMPHPTNTSGDQESFGIEMYSLPGYSGAPVFVRFAPVLKFDFPSSSSSVDAGNTVAYMASGSINLSKAYRALPGGPWLLGVEWGYIHSHDQSKNNTGMTGVVPAWHLRDLLYDDRCIEKRKAEQQDLIRQSFSGHGPGQV